MKESAKNVLWFLDDVHVVDLIPFSSCQAQEWLFTKEYK